MATTDWYRRTTWTLAAREDFASRLKRSRSFNRGQYLRIQAWHLAQSGSRELTHAALELLDQILRDHPDSFDMASTHLQRGECLARLGRADDALAAYRAALAVERERPYIRTLAYLGFAELILALDRRALYPEALAALEEFGADGKCELFPANRYRAMAARAFLHDALGDRARAAQHARDALAASAATESPFRKHRKLGLAKSPPQDVHARLWRLARQAPDPRE